VSLIVEVAGVGEGRTKSSIMSVHAGEKFVNI